MAYKFEGGQQVYLANTDREVVIKGRSEFFNGKQNRYYIEAVEGALPGKNNHEDWINEDGLSAEKPPAHVENNIEAKKESGQIVERTPVGAKKAGIRTTGL